jgi:glycosyltransferase involved in cell wall biosynthesis
MSLSKVKIALVFDWMTVKGGAEKVNLQLHKMYKEAPIFCSIFDKEKHKEFLDTTIVTSIIDSLPFSKQKHQFYLGLMPQAYEAFDLSEFDIVVSSSHSCAKGIITKPSTLHICYCHSPMRYAWDNWQEYIQNYNTNRIVKSIAKRKMHKIRMWDRLSAERVDYFIANSNTTKRRIKKYYNKESTVIHPSIDCSKYKIAEKSKGYFLAVGRLTPYKKFDLIIETFNKIGLPLKIVGSGGDQERLKAMAKGNIEFLGYTEEKELKKLYSECEALIFPQVEDFGLTPLECMASGRPVIALKEGGALDTIIQDKTGVFFNKQTPEDLKKAIKYYQDNKKKFKKSQIRAHAENFDKKEFKKQFDTYLKQQWKHWEDSRH